MQYLTIIGTVALVHILALISPGPDFIMAVRNSLMYSRKTGVFTAVGFGLGMLVHIAYCVAGLALIISQSILVFNVIKLLGAGYLIYVGFKSFVTKSGHLEFGQHQKQVDISPWAAIRAGFLTNVLNPKVTLFFLSLFTFVIAPDTPVVVVIAASLIMILDTILWFSLVSVFMTQARIRAIFEKFQGVFNKTLGGLLILLGIKIALTEK